VATYACEGRLYTGKAQHRETGNVLAQTKKDHASRDSAEAEIVAQLVRWYGREANVPCVEHKETGKTFEVLP
jgi:hypothetical protein